MQKWSWKNEIKLISGRYFIHLFFFNSAFVNKTVTGEIQ